MGVDIILLIMIGILISIGVYLLLEKALTRILLGLLLLSNAINLLLLVASGHPGVPAFYPRYLISNMSDPLAQALGLTSIVISMATAAFIIALSFRSYQLNRMDLVKDDETDLMIGSEEGTTAAEELLEDEDDYAGDADTRVDRVDVDDKMDHTADIPLVEMDRLKEEI